MSRVTTVLLSPLVQKIRQTRSYLDWSILVMVKFSSKSWVSPELAMVVVFWG